MSEKERKKHIASVSDATLEAIAAGRFRFGTPAQAMVVLDRVYKNFVTCREQDPIGEDGRPSLKLWIRDFQVSEQEKQKGFKGHFARITIRDMEREKFTLHAEKIITELKHHPEKSRAGRRHPDTGHPILRAAIRGKIYAQIELARKELELLHEEFPEITIPGADKLHLLLYVREEKPPVKKMTLRIEEVEGQGFRLTLSDNVKKNKTPLPPVVASAQATQPAEGKFSSMVAMQRKKKLAKPKKKPDAQA
jgi:hypothetical protein